MSVAPPPFPVRELFGVPVAAVTMAQAVAHISAAVASRQQILVGVVNAAKIVNMRRDRVLRDDVLSSDVIFADGASVVWASRLLRRPLPERVAGIDLMLEILRTGSERGWGVYLLGATTEVLAGTAAKIAADYPGVRITGRQHGYFGPDEERRVAEDITASGADVLFVAMTSPKKEGFLARWRVSTKVPVCHGVGGSFDVLAGKVDRAPLAWQRLGMEWLYRVKQEPTRLWRRYLVTNTLFCAMVVGELVRPRRGRAAS